MDIGQRIRNRRKELLIKQKELARKVGISQNAMVSIEKGWSKPSYNTLEKICEVLRMSIVFIDDCSDSPDAETIDLNMRIKYDSESRSILKYAIGNEYTLGEIAVVIATFKKCFEDWGYEVIRKEELI